MAIPFSGPLKRSGGLSFQIFKQLNEVTLQPVKKVTFKFDPFHENIKNTRFFMYHINTTKVLKTNYSCIFNTEVVCDRSEPSINFKLENGEEVTFKSEHLTVLEMLELYNKHISVLAIEETVSDPAIPTTGTNKSTEGKRN